jgi:hypothetical protein
VLLLLNGSDYLARFTPDQMHALAALFFDLHEHGLDNVAQWKQLALESASYNPCRFLVSLNVAQGSRSHSHVPLPADSLCL